jgi:hypothetical protein
VSPAAPAERDSRWALSVRFTIEAAGQAEARVIIGQMLASLDREKALRDLRRRLGPAPVKAMFETVAVPLAPPGTPGVFSRGLRTVSFDGLNSVKVPDSGRNRSWLARR